MGEEINWNVKDIIKSEKEFLQLIKEIEKDLPKIDQYFKKLSPAMSVKLFKEMIYFEEELGEKVTRLGTYLALIGSTNTKSQLVMKYQPKLENLSVKIADKERLISHWLQGLQVKDKKTLDNKNAKRLFSSLPYHRESLEYSRNKAKHTLPEEVEKIIHRKDINGVETMSELYDKITTDFTFELKVKGKKPIIIDNQEKLKKYVYSPKTEEREAAYKALFASYRKRKEVLFTIYAAIVKDWRTEQELRKYKTAISIKNVHNQLDDKVIATLLDVCTKNRRVFQDYFRIKAKELGMKKLSRTDIYAPIEKTQKKYSFKEAKDIVFKVFNEFHPEFKNKAEKLFKEKHIDSHPKQNKRSGAYCMSITGSISPYVLLNFTGTERDVSTIAHELGHAIHDLYTAPLPHSVSHASLPLCETASTFGEMLLFEELLKNADKKKRKILLMDKISDSYASIMRQAYFIKFEIEAHKKLPEGITEEELSNLWLTNLQEQFGTAVNVPEYFKYEWSYIPHIFHYPFYCYSYSFGELLSLSLYAAYKKQGKSFIPKLERILAAGGSKDPAKLLKKEGFDITKESFWQGGFEILKTWMKELKKI